MPPQGSTKERPATYEEIISALAEEQGIAPELALAVAKKESNLNPKAIGDGGKAVGMFQLHTGAAADTDTTNRLDPIQNIEGGIKYLSILNKKYDGDVHKILTAYNGGMEHVDAGTVSPEARAYADEIIKSLSALPPVKKETAQTPPTAVPAPATATKGAIRRFAGELGQSAIVEPLTGLGTMAKTLVTEGPVALGTQVARGVTEPIVTGLKKATAARREGEYLTWAKELVGAIPLYGPTLKAAAEEAGQGNLAGAAGRVVGGIVPIRGLRDVPGRNAAAAVVKQSAQKSMTKLFTAAGDGSKAAERAITQIVPLALDQSLLRVTRGRWARAVEEAKSGLGKQVGAAMKGRVGDEIVPIKPVVDGLEGLKQTVTNYVPVNSAGEAVGAGARGARDLKAVAFNARVVRQADRLEKILEDHGPTVQLRQLVNLRRDWDDFVYSSKSWLNKEDMVKQYEARAKSAATDAIRGIINEDPRFVDLSKLDKAYHLHSQLYSFIADEAFGKGHGGGAFYPGFGMQNAMIRRGLSAAVRSPTWRLLPIKAKLKLAESIATNDQGAVLRILRPVIGASTIAVGRGEDQSEAP